MSQQEPQPLFRLISEGHWRSPTVIAVTGGKVAEEEKPAQIHLRLGGGIQLDIPLTQAALEQLRIMWKRFCLNLRRRGDARNVAARTRFSISVCQVHNSPLEGGGGDALPWRALKRHDDRPAQSCGDRGA